MSTAGRHASARLKEGKHALKGEKAGTAVISPIRTEALQTDKPKTEWPMGQRVAGPRVAASAEGGAHGEAYPTCREGATGSRGGPAVPFRLRLLQFRLQGAAEATLPVLD